LSFANDSRKYSSPITLFPDDIPEPYLRSTSALLCSTDFLSMRMLPPHLRLNGIRTLLLKPSAGSMNSQFWNDFPVLVRGCTGLICTKKEALNLFLDKSENLLEIAETITSYGLEFVVITCGKDGQILFIRSERTHWQVPAFPTKVIDCIHSSDTFSGSFLAGFLKNYDPLMATFYGNIASSIKIEGSGATYLLDALPELAVARMNVLKDRARKI
jgi:sugar/nucleoside kinase (ribokinase family)